MAIYTVQQNDTLYDIAYANATQYGYSNWQDFLMDIIRFNDIDDTNNILVGEKLRMTDDDPSPAQSTSSSQASVTRFGLVTNTQRTMYAVWTWSKSSETDKYQVRWSYMMENAWFVGSDTSVAGGAYLSSTYTAPENSTQVKFTVKPIAKEKEKTVRNTVTLYIPWTASWSTSKTYNFASNPPETPPVPTVEIDRYKLTASLANLDTSATSIEFQVIKNDTGDPYKNGTAKIETTSASWSCTVDAGGRYKVRCRGVKGSTYSAWTSYSENVTTVPSVPKSITKCSAASKTSVALEWEAVTNAITYDIEFATKKSYFDVTDQTQTVSGILTTNYEKTGLESGQEYFFRVRATNEQGSSEWSDIKSVVIGTTPESPTTWSSTTTAVVGEDLTLYWVHNSEDNSKETFAQIELIVNDTTLPTITVQNEHYDDEDWLVTSSSYVLDTSSMPTGATIKWRVRTAGITREVGDGKWSIQRTINVYAPATLSMNILNSNHSASSYITSFPFYISISSGPDNQTPTSYNVTITSNETYDTVDNVGNEIIIGNGEEVFSRNYDVDDHSILIELTASNISLENNIAYTVTCRVSMDSGLTAEDSSTFTIGWDEFVANPNAEIIIDRDQLVAHVCPNCDRPSLISIYRREFDGKFIEIATDIDSESNTFVTDPHPALDFARYRLVAKDESTGIISYYDVPGVEFGESSVVIQWDETWSEFDADPDETLEAPAWSGSMLKLPYNIDITDTSDPDAELIEYIGRENPVSYYGTQIGSSSSWNVDIPKNDINTLYALRRLARWKGDVYVREPSGSGYWANVKVSFSQKHRNLIIPVTFSIKRVEGGM